MTWKYTVNLFNFSFYTGNIEYTNNRYNSPENNLEKYNKQSASTILLNKSYKKRRRLIVCDSDSEVDNYNSCDKQQG